MDRIELGLQWIICRGLCKSLEEMEDKQTLH